MDPQIFSYFLLPDYTGTFGMTLDEISNSYTELSLLFSPYYTISNYYVNMLAFNVDENTEKITAFRMVINDGIASSDIHTILSSKYNYYQNNDENTMFAYRDGNSQETSKIMIIYNAETGIISFFDLENYTSNSSTQSQKSIWKEDLSNNDELAIAKSMLIM
ncbi:MAG: hypothetical protein Q4P84_04285 [Elusimicrobiales bacterium]|nr:hypothetical protein [Elusimicrobiales bacterium]